MKRAVILLVLFLFPACSGITCSQKRHRAIRYTNDGVRQFTEGLHAPALSSLKAAVAEDDSFPLAHYNLAKIYQEMKRWDDAQRHLNRVITLEPDNARHHYDLGMCYHMLGRMDLAETAYQKALSLNPKMYAGHYRLGMVHAAQDKPREADAAFRRSIEINPRFIKAFVALGLLYLDHDYPELALQVLQTGVTINETSAEAHNMLGVAYQVLKQYPKAIASFQQALEIDRDLIGAVYNLGMTYAMVGKNKEAEDMLNRFIKAATGKADVDPDFVRGANEKLADLMGMGGSGDSAPPSRLE